MARIMAGGLEMQDLTNGRWFEITAGGLDGSPIVRGENVSIPSKTGQTHMTKVAHEFHVTMHGIIFGEGVNTYFARMAALRVVFDPLADPFNIVVYPDAVSVGGRVPAGDTATITVEFLRFTGPPAVGDEVRMLDIECVCISDPIGWQVA